MKLLSVILPKKIWLQIGLVFAVILTISLLLLGFLLIGTSRTAVKDSVLRDYEVLAGDIARGINDFIDQPRNLLVNTGQILGVIPIKDIESHKVLLYQLITDYPNLFERVALCGIDGKEMLGSDWANQPRDYSQSDVFKKASVSRKPELSRVYFSTEHFAYLTLAVPVKRLDTPSSVLIAEVKLNHLWRILSEIQLKDAEVFLVDEQGYALVHNEEKKVYQGENLIWSVAVQSVLQGKTGSIDEGSQDKDTARQWLSAYAPIEQFGWGLIIRQPVKNAYAFSFRMQEKSALIIAGAIILTIILSLVIANWIVSPIKKLTAVADKVAEGNLEQEIKADRDDEVGKLLSAFDGMIKGLKKAKRMEKLSAIGTATSKIAHEIRNPLAAMKTFVQLLPRRTQDGEFIQQFNQTVPQEIGRLEKLLGMMRDFSAGRQLTLSQTDIVPVIRNILGLLQEQIAKQNIKVLTDFTGNSISLLLDADKIRQVILNLVQNALQSMPAGGELRIYAGTEQSNSRQVLIKVGDTGCGMDRTQLDNLFEPFHTSKPGGLGLGLTISKEIVELHKGTIEVESEKDKGTVFTITLRMGASDEE